MDILGIGPLELFFIILIALIVLGPKDMVKAGRSIGRTMRKIVTSENWRTIQQASQEIKNIPTRLMREAGLDEAQREMTAITGVELTKDTKKSSTNIEPWKADLSDWVTPQNTIAPPITGLKPPENKAKSEQKSTTVDAPGTQQVSESTETD